MNVKQEIGKIGEDLACKWIKSRGFKIIDRNYRQKYGEIDIISIAPDKSLVFFEVKTMRKSSGIISHSPEDQLTQAKLIKLQRICYLYANAHQKLFSDKVGWRIDLLAIDLLSKNFWRWKHQIRHYENI